MIFTLQVLKWSRGEVQPPPSKDSKLTLLPWSSCAHFSTWLLATSSVPTQCLDGRLLPLGGQASGASEDTNL